MLPRNAATKPATTKPGTNAAAVQTRGAVRTSGKGPHVSTAGAAAAGGARGVVQSGGEGRRTVAAGALLARNEVDGGAGSKAAWQVQVGTYDSAKAQFSKGGASPNAVLVRVPATVENTVAGL